VVLDPGPGHGSEVAAHIEAVRVHGRADGLDQFPDELHHRAGLVGIEVREIGQVAVGCHQTMTSSVGEAVHEGKTVRRLLDDEAVLPGGGLAEEAGLLLALGTQDIFGPPGRPQVFHIFRISPRMSFPSITIIPRVLALVNRESHTEPGLKKNTPPSVPQKGACVCP